MTFSILGVRLYTLKIELFLNVKSKDLGQLSLS